MSKLLGMLVGQISQDLNKAALLALKCFIPQQNVETGSSWTAAMLELIYRADCLMLLPSSLPTSGPLQRDMSGLHPAKASPCPKQPDLGQPCQLVGHQSRLKSQHMSQTPRHPFTGLAFPSPSARVACLVILLYYSRPSSGSHSFRSEHLGIKTSFSFPNVAP